MPILQKISTWWKLNAPRFRPATSAELQNVKAEILAAITTNNNPEELMDLQAILAKVTAQKTVIDSNTTLLNELSGLLKNSANDPATILAIANGLDTNTQAINDAIVANTPAAPAQ